MISDGFKETELGLIPEDWQMLELGDVCSSISDTYDLSQKENIVFLNTGDILNGKIIKRNIYEVEKLPGQAKKKILKNDILFSEIRPANKRFAFIDFDSEEYVVSTKLMVLRSNNKIIPKFLFHFLKSPLILNYFQGLAESRSGTFPQITFNTVKNTPLRLPSLNEQKIIVSYIESLEEKIYINHQINQTLQEIAQTIFRHWFVHFEFPNENGQPYKSNGGELVDSELGKIPTGWSVEKLEDYMDFLEGPGIRNWQYTNEGIPFINIRLINNGEIDTSKANFVSENELEKYNHFLLQENDLVISTSGTLGRYAVVRKDHLPLLLNTSVIRFRPKCLAYSYMYYYLTSNIFYEELLIQATGSAQLNFGPMHLKRIIMLLPDKNLQSKFETIIRPLLDKMNNNMSEIIRLESIRDSILPKLMSGKIRVNISEETSQ